MGGLVGGMGGAFSPCEDRGEMITGTYGMGHRHASFLLANGEYMPRNKRVCFIRNYRIVIIARKCPIVNRKVHNLYTFLRIFSVFFMFCSLFVRPP